MIACERYIREKQEIHSENTLCIDEREPMSKRKGQKSDGGGKLGIEDNLWVAADKLGGSTLLPKLLSVEIAADGIRRQLYE